MEVPIMTRQNPLGKIVCIAVVLGTLLMMMSLMVAAGSEATDTCDEVIGDFDAEAGDGDNEVHLEGEVPGENDKIPAGYIPTPEEEFRAGGD